MLKSKFIIIFNTFENSNSEGLGEGASAPKPWISSPLVVQCLKISVTFMLTRYQVKLYGIMEWGWTIA